MNWNAVVLLTTTADNPKNWPFGLWIKSPDEDGNDMNASRNLHAGKCCLKHSFLEFKL